MVITVYKLDPSPPSRAVLMTADLLGLNITTVDVNTFVGENKTPEFLEKNPLHKVPLLEDDDFILDDSHAIITYLVSKYGAEKRATLYPSDLRTRAIVDQRLYFDATILFPKIISLFVSIVVEGAPGPSDKIIAEINEAYGFTEKYLERSSYIAGDHLTLADVSCVASISSIDAVVPLGEEFSKVREWWEKLQAQKWYKVNLPGLAKFGGHVKQAMETNAKAQ